MNLRRVNGCTDTNKVSGSTRTFVKIVTFIKVPSKHMCKILLIAVVFLIWHAYLANHLQTRQGAYKNCKFSQFYESEPIVKVFLLHNFEFFQVLQCDAPYRGHPKNLFYKLANQDTRISLTVTPRCKVQQASDAQRIIENKSFCILQLTCLKCLLGGHGSARRTVRY